MYNCARFETDLSVLIRDILKIAGEMRHDLNLNERVSEPAALYTQGRSLTVYHINIGKLKSEIKLTISDRII